MSECSFTYVFVSCQNNSSTTVSPQIKMFFFAPKFAHKCFFYPIADLLFSHCQLTSFPSVFCSSPGVSGSTSRSLLKTGNSRGDRKDNEHYHSMIARNIITVHWRKTPLLTEMLLKWKSIYATMSLT